ncbi:hypothetical protein NDU88_003892 [Pleurodeles waltl]|uniref:Uncharacterized protein n=1 Tax=Pleurodeles waltl TaxID=8319 RepID=A0AAV7PBB3_PLEWA|nr:hypothetical protein NDU88_003892 [Pleurodeles waltl]
MASQGVATTQLSMQNQGENQELDIEEIIKAAREAAATCSKDWILKQIWGDGVSESPAQEEHAGDGPSVAARDEEEPPSELKKRQRNTIRGAKKGDKKESGDLPEAGVPGPSKQAKPNNGEQISVIVQECLKSMAPLLFANPGGARKTSASGEAEPKGDTALNDTQGKGGPRCYSRYVTRATPIP